MRGATSSVPRGARTWGGARRRDPSQNDHSRHGTRKWELGGGVSAHPWRPKAVAVAPGSSRPPAHGDARPEPRTMHPRRLTPNVSTRRDEAAPGFGTTSSGADKMSHTAMCRGSSALEMEAAVGLTTTVGGGVSGLPLREEASAGQRRGRGVGQRSAVVTRPPTAPAAALGNTPSARHACAPLSTFATWG